MAIIPLRVVGVRALRAKLRNLTNSQAVTVSLHARLTDAWNASVEAFVRAAITRVRVDTGMSAASFLPLATASGRTRALQAIEDHIAKNIKRGRAPGIFSFPSGTLIPSQFRSRFAGERAGRLAFRLTYGRPQLPRFVFTFQTTVFQLEFYEADPMQQALFHGQLAFLGRVTSAFRRAGRFAVDEYLTGRRIRGGPLSDLEFTLFGNV